MNYRWIQYYHDPIGIWRFQLGGLMDGFNGLWSDNTGVVEATRYFAIEEMCNELLNQTRRYIDPGYTVPLG